MKTLDDYIRAIPDFPKEGIIFRDITTVLQDPDGFKLCIDSMNGLIEDIDYDVIVGAEARGFALGGPLAYLNNKSFVLVRKKGKLPAETISQEYDLEYGTAAIEIHKDAIKPGQKVVIVDDLLATGGTVEAIIKLVEKLGGVVAGIVVMVELKGLNGRDRLKGYRVDTAISYDGK